MGFLNVLMNLTQLAELKRRKRFVDVRPVGIWRDGAIRTHEEGIYGIIAIQRYAETRGDAANNSARRIINTAAAGSAPTYVEYNVPSTTSNITYYMYATAYSIAADRYLSSVLTSVLPLYGAFRLYVPRDTAQPEGAYVLSTDIDDHIVIQRISATNVSTDGSIRRQNVYRVRDVYSVAGTEVGAVPTLTRFIPDVDAG